MTVFAAIALVVCLFRSGSPAAVFRTVAGIVINPINGKTGRPLSHVCKEVFKRIPALAYFYSAPAIVSVALIVWVAAALPHVLPYLVCGCLLVIAAMAMSNPVCSQGLIFQAPTRFCLAGPELRQRYYGHLSAIAYAVPLRHSALRIFSPRNNNQSRKSLPCSINKFRHRARLQTKMNVNLILARTTIIGSV